MAILNTYPQAINNALTRLGVTACWMPTDPQAGIIKPHEIKTWGVEQDTYVKDGQFTRVFEKAVKLADDLALNRHPETVPAVLREKAQADLAERKLQIQFTHLDAKNHTRSERVMARHILQAGEHIRRLFLLQRDPYNLVHEQRVWGLADPLAVELFANNHGPYTETFETGAKILTGIGERNPGAHLYPPEFNPEKFQALSKLEDGEALTSPFVAIEKNQQGYQAVPFGQHPLFKEEAAEVARHLRLAAKSAKAPRGSTQKEKKGWAAFRAYLIAAADAMVSDKPRPWDKADEAWINIPVDFKWGLRIGPDETYWDKGTGIQGHAGYHMFFGLYDNAAKDIVAQLKKFGFQRMEDELVKLMNSPAYKRRKVSADVPLKGVRTIMVVGDARHSHGTIAGFSLPNWGTHAGKAKWAINAETPQSKERREKFIRTFLGEEYVKFASASAGTSNTITHEFFHGFGPQNDTQVRNSKGIPQTNPDGTKTQSR